MTRPMSPSCSVSSFAARRARAPMSCISRIRERKHSTSLPRASSPQLIVILSDINMPIMDGLELLRQIKTRRPDLPVMMVTAYGDDERRRLAGEYGAAEFITNPVDFDFL